MTLLGYFLGKDIFWVITETPYLGEENPYGSGSILHYFKEAPLFFGVPLIVLFLTYVLYLFYRVYNNFSDQFIWKEISFLFLPALTFFFAHVFMWWLGKGGSYGLTRVMACITPFFAILAARTMDFLTLKNMPFRIFVLILVSFIVLYYPFYIKEFPIEQTPQQKLMSNTCEWIKKINYKKIYYFDQFSCFLLNKNPHNHSEAKELFDLNSSVNISDNALLIWDSQFGNEREVLLEKLIVCDSLNPVYSAHTTIHNSNGVDFNDYDIVVFEKKSSQSKSYFESFDTTKIKSINTNSILDLSNNYTSAIDFNYLEVKEYSKLLFKTEGNSFSQSIDSELNIVFSLSDSKGNLIAYRGMSIPKRLTNSFRETHTINLPQFEKTDLKVSVYIWLVSGNDKVKIEKFDIYGIKQNKY